ALVIAGTMFASSIERDTDVRIEQTLVAEARLVAALLSDAGRDPQTPSTVTELDAEADRLGNLVNARVTFIAPDGRVLGDSAESLEGVAAMDNHGTRPEVIAARQSGI